METQPPPIYQSDRPGSQPAKMSGTATEPLLSSYHDQDLPGDESDGDSEDFKYGSTVSSSALEIRHAFVRKVYSTLFVQLAFTTIIGATFKHFEAQYWLAAHSYMMFVFLGGSIASMIALFMNRQKYPLNMALLSLFTAFEAASVGSIVVYYDQRIVLQALVITTFVFVGLTLFAMQTKYDFLSWGGILYTGLLSFFFVGIAGVFFPFSSAIETLYAALGVLLFSGYILYDTQAIMNRLSPDEWVLAVVSLYLDIINLFLSILRLLNSTERD